eukprot:5623151-Amphidinium_carterae.1
MATRLFPDIHRGETNRNTPPSHGSHQQQQHQRNHGYRGGSNPTSARKHVNIAEGDDAWSGDQQATEWASPEDH